MPKALRNLAINRVDLVQMGANFDRRTGDGSHITLMKRSPFTMPDTVAKAFGDVVAAYTSAGVDVTAAIAIQKQTFGEILAVHDACEQVDELREMCWMFIDSAQSILYSDEANKIATLRRSADEFVAALLAAMPDVTEALEKSAIGSKRARTMRAFKSALVELTTHEGETTMPVPEAVSTVTKEAMDAAIATAVAKAVTDLKSENEALKVSVTKAQTDATAAQAEAETERATRVRKDMAIELAKSFDGVPALEIEKDVDHFAAIRKAAPDAWKRVEELLANAATAIRKGALFSETGRAGSASGGGDAQTALFAEADRMVVAKSATTREQAIDTLISSGSPLAKAYLDEREAARKK